MKVRPADIGDYEALCGLLRQVDDLHAELLPRFFRRSRKNPRSRSAVERILAAPDEAMHVAVDGAGEITGLVHVQIYDTPPLAFMVPRRRAHVDTLVVERALRRQGIGRKLLDAACRWSRAQGADELLLTVWAGNRPAERFYERLGFQKVNTVLAREL